MSGSRTLLYTGSFDPLTNGHLDVVRRACALAERVVVAIGVHPGKAPVFSAAERAEMIREVFGPLAQETGVALEVETFDDLAVAVARRVGAGAIIRGLRDGTDLDYEMQMAAMNEAMAPEIRTIFVPASPAVRPITATLVRQIAALGGAYEAFVPPAIARRLDARFPRPTT
jgi:pantetheine-phosphate adenylyltransferase